jgi:hypothetical protein
VGRGGTRSGWDALGRGVQVGTPWDDTLINSSFGTRWDALGRGGTRWDAVGRGGTRWDAVGRGGTRWDAVGRAQVGTRSGHIVGTPSWDALRLGRARPLTKKILYKNISTHHI